MNDSLRKLLKPYYRPFKWYLQKRAFKKGVSSKRGEPLKIVIGSSKKYEKGWIPSEEHFLDLLDEKTWLTYFKENQIDYLMAEHVWEHLTLEDGGVAVANCYKFLKPGGQIRVAVPDGLHPDPDYIDYVKVNGTGDGADDHKVLYNYKSLRSVFEDQGFKVKLLEYFDEKNEFHVIDWETDKGLIRRSIKYDRRNADGRPNYTSVIIDAVKI